MTNSTMTCEEFDAALPDHLEGTLGGSLRSAVEGHLRECVRCASLVKDLRNIEADAAKLPELAPSRDLWQGIESRIAAPVIPLAARPERTRRFAPAWMGIAAAALIVTTAGITYTLTARSLSGSKASVATVTPAAMNQPNTGDSSAPESVAAGTAVAKTDEPAPASPTTGANRGIGEPQNRSTALMVTRTAPSEQTVPSEAVYSKEIAALQHIVNDRKTQLDSATLAIIERNLRIIDLAIEQSKAALAKDPASRLLSDQLTHALDKKVELLRTAAMLPANT